MNNTFDNIDNIIKLKEDDIIKFLKNNKDFNLNIKDSNNNYFLQHIIIKNYKKLFLFIILNFNNLELDIIDKDNRSITYYVIRFNRIEILKMRLDDLYDQKYGLDERIENLYKRKKQQKKLVLEKYFNTELPEDYSIFIKSDENVELRAGDSKYAIGDFYFYDRWGNDGNAIEKAEISLSSFRAEVEGNWISKRFEAISKFVMIAEDFGDDIIAELNMIEKRYNILPESIYQSRKELKKSIDMQSADIDKLKKEQLMERLFNEDGISLTPEKDDNYLPRFEVKWDWEISNVAGLRVVKKSTSGKSVDLEIKRRFRDYGSDDWKFDTLKADRVRFDKVESFLNRNKKYIG